MFTATIVDLGDSRTPEWWGWHLGGTVHAFPSPAACKLQRLPGELRMNSWGEPRLIVRCQNRTSRTWPARARWWRRGQVLGVHFRWLESTLGCLCQNRTSRTWRARARGWRRARSRPWRCCWEDLSGCDVLWSRVYRVCRVGEPEVSRVVRTWPARAGWSGGAWATFGLGPWVACAKTGHPGPGGHERVGGGGRKFLRR